MYNEFVNIMEITIDLPDKIYDEIKQMCEFNGITIIKYAFDCVLDNYNTMKYGDLNEKLGIKEEPKEETKNIETPIIEKKKPGRPRKKKDEEILEKQKEEIKVVENKKVETIEPVKTIKRTRILKSK